MNAFLLPAVAWLAALVWSASALAALLLLPHALRARNPFRRDDLSSWAMLAMLLWLPVTLTWSLSPGLATERLVVLLALPLAWLAGRYLAQVGRLVPLLDWAVPTSLAALVLWGILQGPQTYTAKPQGPFIDPNTYAAALNLLALPLLARWLAADPLRLGALRRTAGLTLLAAAVFAAGLVASRGATLAFLLALPLILWSTRRAPHFGWKIAVLGVACTWAYWAAGYAMRGVQEDSGIERLLTTVHKGDSPRLMLFEAAWHMIAEVPWLGHGLSAFRLLYPSFRTAEETGSAGGWVHNDYLQLWLEAGLPMAVFLLVLLIWVLWQIGQTLKGEGGSDDPRIGYLAALLALFVHALVNFLFYFAFIAVVAGLYLAHLGARQSVSPAPMPRAARIAAAGYVLIVGWLMLGQLAVDTLLGQGSRIQRQLMRFDVAYPRYEVAYWLSVAHPFHPAPQHVMGRELADAYLLLGSSDPKLLQAAVSRMRTSQRLAPCLAAYSNEVLALLASTPGAPTTPNIADEIVHQALVCNPRHGLTHYYAGSILRGRGSEAEALAIWHEGLRRSVHLGERFYLAAAILAHERPEHREDISRLADEMANAWRALEANPFLKPDLSFWHAAQLRLLAWGGERFVTLADPMRGKEPGATSQVTGSGLA